jgi:SPP1 gp7 family putative phage head morphogenesis protein
MRKFRETNYSKEILLLKKIFGKEIKDLDKLIKSNILGKLSFLLYDSNSNIISNSVKKVKVGFFGSLIDGEIIDDRKKKKDLFKKIRIVLEDLNKKNLKNFSYNFFNSTKRKPQESKKKTSDLVKDIAKDNAKKITTLAVEYIDQVDAIIVDGFREGRENKTIIEEVKKKIVDVSDSKKANAKLIATDQIQKLNGELDKIRQKANGSTRYIWRTRGNEAVRDDHKRLEGAIFEWGKPPITVTSGKRSGERNEPAQDINCKCYAEFIVEDITGEKTKKITIAEEKTKKLKDKGFL